jgi:hypothetical protein
MDLQDNGKPLGQFLKKDKPVQSLSDIYAIAHSSIFKEIAFDKKFESSLGMADFCLRAYTVGFDVLAMQLKCQYKRDRLLKKAETTEELKSRRLFKKSGKISCQLEL